MIAIKERKEKNIFINDVNESHIILVKIYSKWHILMCIEKGSDKYQPMLLDNTITSRNGMNECGTIGFWLTYYNLQDSRIFDSMIEVAEFLAKVLAVKVSSDKDEIIRKQCSWCESYISKKNCDDCLDLENKELRNFKCVFK